MEAETTDLACGINVSGVSRAVGVSIVRSVRSMR